MRQSRWLVRGSFVSLIVAAPLWFVACSSGPAPTPDAPPVAHTTGAERTGEPVHVRLLAFNDFHGHLEGPSGTVLVGGDAVQAGGVGHLAAHIERLRAEHPDTLVVAAGDLIGASPLISALFHDEPTAEALTLSGLDIAAVGNHEFDRGVDELLRIQHGGCHPEAGCGEGRTYEGAGFQYLAANVRYRESGETILPGVEIREVAGVKIAFIGLTLEGTPEVVTPSAIETVTFDNEIETINALVPGIREQGIETIVVLVHEGGYPGHELTDINDCPEISGPIVEIVRGVDRAVDLFVTGHTHQPYICEVDERLVTSAQSFGRLLTKIELQIDPETGDVLERTARQVVVDRSIKAAAPVAQLVDTYRTASAELAGRAVGRIGADLLREANDAGESVLGRVIADAQLAATRAPEAGGAVIAFMNPGGIRDSLLFERPGSEGAAAPEPGVVTYAELHTVQPFANMLVTLTLTGEQIHRLLEQQWIDQPNARLLQVSAGFSYRWDASRPVGEKVDPASIMLDGEPVEPAKEYRVTVNNFLANGGDGYTVFTEGKAPVIGPIDLDALVDYVTANSPVEAPLEARIERVQ